MGRVWRLSSMVLSRPHTFPFPYTCDCWIWARGLCPVWTCMGTPQWPHCPGGTSAAWQAALEVLFSLISGSQASPHALKEGDSFSLEGWGTPNKSRDMGFRHPPSWKRGDTLSHEGMLGLRGNGERGPAPGQGPSARSPKLTRCPCAHGPTFLKGKDTLGMARAGRAGDPQKQKRCKEEESHA